MKRWGFGTLKLKPNEFWSLTIWELIEMMRYHNEEEAQKLEREEYRIAWQTSLLMNATGNYKRAITPEKLLGLDKDGDKKKESTEKVNIEEKNEKLSGLKAKFN
ncbi:phage tail assembly chaperone [Bacillus pseudomycoides]|uniref:phage tail assembly chaperone n=1 Tax=Bacillus pseudomycoides TaxID=64104 RepID=UPI0015CF25F6|nr:phage tail assembly chaperone [Bacillus pseudomycoides]